MAHTHILHGTSVYETVVLADRDRLSVDAGGFLAVYDGTRAVVATGSRLSIHNEGEIRAYYAKAITADLTGDVAVRIANLMIGGGGTLIGRDGAIELRSDADSTGEVRIVNSSAIRSGGVVIDFSGLHVDHTVVLNNGRIDIVGTGTAAFVGSAGADRLVNSGLIGGHVDLGAGDDRLRSTGNIFAFGSTVDLGAGDDRFLSTGETYGTILGGDGDDRIAGGTGNETIVGGAGRDVMSGGTGGAIFVFNALADSAADREHADRILDFDKANNHFIALQAIDADATTAGDQAFTFVGDAAFSGKAGELRCDVTHAGAVLYADVNGDGLSDFALVVDGNVTSPADFQQALGL